MKEKNKGKKSLTAVGALVAAGLTPGIVTALPTQGSNAGLTAAEVVAIDGNAYSFDELSAMQRENSVDTIEMHIVLEPDPHAPVEPMVVAYGTTKYGVRGMYTPINRVAEEEPRFPDGEAALMKYVESHIVYPPKAAKNNVQGEVIVQFVVDKTGQVGDVTVVTPLDRDLDAEAVRVVKGLPKFIPGNRNGEAVNMWYTLTIPFKLPAEKNN